MKPRTVTIFTKPGCGLCEEAEEVIEAVRARMPFTLERRNILDNLDEYEKYKHDIPVIQVDGVEIARHRLSEAQLESALVAETPASRSTIEQPRAAAPHRDAGVATTGDPVIIVMAKYPTPGTVKTRLTPALTAAQAARVHREFLLHVVARLGSRRVIVGFDPPEAQSQMRQLLDAELMPQSAGDLGERLAAAATAAARRISPGVIFLGVDSPDVPMKYIDRVAELLASHDVVIAPADDGGYWAVALSAGADAAKLFAGIEWSSGREGAQTLERARELGYNVALADQWADVDRPADLSRLIERLRRSSEPDDRKLLARLAEFLPDAE